MTDEATLTSCLNIMRRLPPNKVAQNLSALLRIVPDATDDLLQRVDQPLEETKDPETVSAHQHHHHQHHHHASSSFPFSHVPCPLTGSKVSIV